MLADHVARGVAFMLHECADALADLGARMARRLPRRVGKPRPAQLAEDAVVVVPLPSFPYWTGHTQLPLQLVAGVAEAGVQPRAPGVRPAVGLAHAARDVERAAALGGDLLPRRAAAAVHARAVRVLVGARGFVSSRPARLAVPLTPCSVPISQTHSTCPVRPSVVLPAVHASQIREPLLFVAELDGHLVQSRLAVVFL